MKSPHREAYEEQGSVLGKPKTDKHIPFKCSSCSKHIRKNEMYIANDAGARWHLRCIMRSEGYSEGFGR